MKNILIWGTGNIAQKLIENGVNGKIIGFIETHKTRDSFRGTQVYGIDDLPAYYDYIIVANTYVNQIYETCKQKGIDLDKVIFIFGVKERVGLSDLTAIKDILGEKNYTAYCVQFGLLEDTFFTNDLDAYEKLNTRESFKIQKQYLWPVIEDKYALAGTVNNNYFWQDLWAARLIYKSGVKSHFDIGSRIDGFVTHLLAMDMEVTLIDIREFPICVENLHTIIDDATGLKQIADDSIQSMSALCSLEHFGLGRYGDPIDPEACFKCFREIQQKLKKGGNLYISVPIGRERLEFNAHRVFYASTIIEHFHQLELVEFSCTAAGEIEYNVRVNKYDEDKHNGNYRFGLFHFVKK